MHCKIPENWYISFSVTEESSDEKDNVEKETTEENKTVKDVKEFESNWEAVKYYFNRFRYYHFIVADTIDKYASAACLWLINMYLKLFMGMGADASSVLTEPDD